MTAISALAYYFQVRWRVEPLTALLRASLDQRKPGTGKRLQDPRRSNSAVGEAQNSAVRPGAREASSSSPPWPLLDKQAGELVKTVADMQRIRVP